MTHGPFPRIEPDVVVVERRAALARVDLASSRQALASAGARAVLAAAVPSLARDPDCYAVVVRHPAAGDVVPDDGGRHERGQPYDLFLALQRFAWLLECFSKPTVHLIGGPVDGPSAALVQCGTHRVGGEHYALALPHAKAGGFPDTGIAHILARLPGHVGEYLALTGQSLAAADALELGFLTQCVPATLFSRIEEALAAAMPVDPLLDELHVDPGPGCIPRDRALIDRCFGQSSIAAMMGELERLVLDGGAAAAFAQPALDALHSAPPLALEVSLRHVREAKALDFRLTLMREARIGREAARWPRPEGPAAPGAVARYFDHNGEAALVLPTRSEMQARRV